MAQAVGEGTTGADADLTLVNTNEQRLDLEQYRCFDTVALGSPGYWSHIAGGSKAVTGDWYIARKSNRRGLETEPYGLFYSRGGGRVRGPFEELFGKMGSQVGETIESYGLTVSNKCTMISSVQASSKGKTGHRPASGMGQTRAGRIESLCP